MEFKETEQKNIRGIQIVRPNERTFHCIISLDTHVGSKESKTEAVGLMYAKALLSGCKGYSRDAFLDAINLLGASVSVSIDRGIVSITITSIDTHMYKVLNLVSSMLTAPTFAQQEIKRIAGLLENELHEEKEDAKTQSLYSLIDALYGEKDRRYVSNTDDVIKMLKTITRKDIQAFHDLATQSAWVYTFSCDEKQQQKVTRTLESLRSEFKESSAQYAGEDIQKLLHPKVVLQSIPSKQNIEINFGGIVPLHINDPEFFAFLFGLNVLGKWGGFAGRLMSTVREKEGLTYGIYARIETASSTEYGYWRIMTFFAPDKVLQGITSTLREMNAIRSHGITKTEYQRFKNIIKTSETLLRDSITSTVGTFHGYQMKGLRYADIEVHRSNMFNVTIADVNKALRKYLNPDTMVIAAAGPVASKAKELQALPHLAKNKK